MLRNGSAHTKNGRTYEYAYIRYEVFDPRKERPQPRNLVALGRTDGLIGGGCKRSQSSFVSGAQGQPSVVRGAPGAVRGADAPVPYRLLTRLRAAASRGASMRHTWATERRLRDRWDTRRQTSLNGRSSGWSSSSSSLRKASCDGFVVGAEIFFPEAAVGCEGVLRGDGCALPPATRWSTRRSPTGCASSEKHRRSSRRTTTGLVRSLRRRGTSAGRGSRQDEARSSGSGGPTDPRCACRARRRTSARIFRRCHGGVIGTTISSFTTRPCRNGQRQDAVPVCQK